MSIDAQKVAAAHYAADLVQDGMIVGLGSGSTAEVAVRLLGERLRSGLRFRGVASSNETATLGRSLGIPLVRLDSLHELDMSIDGADEVDPALNLVKGRGGALLREKLVASAARRFVVVVDESKLVERLGQRAPVPVEVAPFGWTTTQHRLEGFGLTCRLRRAGEHIYTTDNHNYILDCEVPVDMDLASRAVGDAIKCVTGVVEHGLFLGMASVVAVGTADGVKVLTC
jgi:ribose 5-phosphate isomerase A